MVYSITKQDEGFAWVIMVITFVYNLIQASIFMSPAIYLIAWDNTFDVTKAELGTVGSLMNGIACFTGILVGPIIAKYGCRIPSLVGTGICALGMLASTVAPSVEWLYLTYGCVTGLGLGMLGLPPIVCVQYYFNKKRPFALGISLMGHSVGVLVALPFLQLGIHTFGWRGAILLHTGVLLQCFVLGSLFLPIDISQTTETELKETKNQSIAIHTAKGAKDTNSKLTDQEQQHTHSKEVTDTPQDTVVMEQTEITATNNDQSLNIDQKSTTDDKCCMRVDCLSIINKIWNCSLLKNNAFDVFIISVCLAEYCMGIFYKLTPIRAINDGVSEQDASFLPSSTAFVSTCSRLVFSLVANLPNVNRTVLCGCAVLGMAVVCGTSSLAHDFKSYAIFSGSFGIFTGWYISIVFTVMSDIVGILNVAYAHSLLSAFASISMFTSLPLAGYIIDLTGNYDLPFYIFACFAGVAGLLFIFMSCLFPQLRKTKNVTKNTQIDDVDGSKVGQKLASVKHQDRSHYSSTWSLGSIA